ncbi:rCG32492 [Rattus norvegicus]|uniref:RCG32492 n=1 Tax=Rattus norvegicus TaxID=10116 RepID=A6HIK2_RAT|nr:rCG32492 [Rattus norvegicus]
MEAAIQKELPSIVKLSSEARTQTQDFLQQELFSGPLPLSYQTPRPPSLYQMPLHTPPRLDSWLPPSDTHPRRTLNPPPSQCNFRPLDHKLQ